MSSETERVSRESLSGPAPSVARRLLGMRLVRIEGGTRLSGTVVETEAYRGARDPASHAYRGLTRRNEVMFGPPGFAYVYFTMGMHFCLNITTEREGSAGAVLIRALQPVEGIGSMMEKRGVEDIHRVCSGPGNLTRALGIDGGLNGEDIVNSERLFLEEGRRPERVGTSTRVGISSAKGRPWRFFFEGSPFVSKGRPS